MYIVQCIKYIVQNLTNFSELISHILIMPSLEPDTAVLSNRSCIRSQGRFLISSVRSSFSSQELFTLQCSITGFYSATPQCTAVSPQSSKVASVSLQMKGALVQLMHQQKKCNSYDKTERTTTQWVVPTSLDILFYSGWFITKQLRAKSTPGTRSSLGVSRIATQAEEDKCQTWIHQNFYGVYGHYLKCLYHPNQKEIPLHLEGANPPILVCPKPVWRPGESKGLVHLRWSATEQSLFRLYSPPVHFVIAKSLTKFPEVSALFLKTTLLKYFPQSFLL